MENTPAFHPLDYVSALRRRKWWLITPIVLAVIVGVALAMLLPRKYKSFTVLGISLPALSGQVLSEYQRLSGQERSRYLNQVLLSPPVVERVAKDVGLAARMPLDNAVDLIAANTRVSLPPLDPNVPPGSVEQFFVEFTHAEPEMAQRVANTLAEAFIDESSMKRTVRAQETAMFIHEKLEESQTRLRELEAKRRVAQESYMGALPEQTQSNVALVQGLQIQLTNLTNEYTTTQERLTYIDRQLSIARPEIEAEAAAAGAPMISPAAVRVMQLEKELASALNVYTENYPTIPRLRAQLEAAKAEAAKDASQPEEQQLAKLKANPEYRSLVSEKEDLKLRLSSLERQRAEMSAQIARYTSRVETAPRVAQQMVSLDREYELEKAHYADLTRQLREAELAEGVEMSRGSEQFTIIARANYPSTPDSPQVPRLMLITILAGVCLGGALALGREYLDRSIHDARALNDIELPVLGEIPRISHV
jgi:polysaccharide chain length determinant protein (PEP-CTERM system associated)